MNTLHKKAPRGHCFSSGRRAAAEATGSVTSCAQQRPAALPHALACGSAPHRLVLATLFLHTSTAGTFLPIQLTPILEGPPLDLTLPGDLPL